MRRMDRYGQEEDNHLSRLDKNQELYQNVSNNVIYANITDVTNANAYDITSTRNGEYSTREDYQKIQKYQNIEDVPPSKKELEDFNYLYQRRENRVYDINSVLEEARKNRQEKDIYEGKRKLMNKAYNILVNLDKKELEKYREEKKKRILTPEEEEMRELIDTIASKTLAGELDKATTVDLLSDLMATNMLDKVDGSENLSSDSSDEVAVSTEVVEEIPKDSPKEDPKTEEVKVETEEEEKKEEEEKEKELEVTRNPDIRDFYTKSMELSDKDLDLSMEFAESTLPLPVKILIILIIMGMIIATFFFIYQRIH